MLKIRNPFKALRTRILVTFERLSDDKKNGIIFIINSFLSAVPLAILFLNLTNYEIILEYGWYLKLPIYIVSICILIIYFEHYYKWIRKDWDNR